MTRRVFITDDEPLARERLARMVDNLPGYSTCGQAGDGESTLRALGEADPDIILMDIRMPGMDGLEAAAAINQQANPPAIIFCTAYDDYAIKAFKAQAVDYLLKPVRRESLEQALERAGRLNRLQARSLQGHVDVPQITVRTHRGTELINVDSIYFCEAEQKCVTLHHDQGETVTDFTLKELESDYPQAFLRIHRHTLAGTRYIQGMVRSASGQARIVLRGSDIQLPVSRRHQSHVREWLENRSRQHRHPPKQDTDRT